MKKFASLLCLLILGSAVPGWSLNQELQLGYVYDFWDSNFIYHGSESRIPASYRIAGENFAFRLSTSFMMGSYTANGTGNSPAAEFNASDLSDIVAKGTIGIPMGGDLRSTVEASVNFPSGNQQWEAKAATGSVPYIFVPSYYHGRGWGGDLFYVLGSSAPELHWSAGMGYMRTTSYDTAGVLNVDLLSPWGAFVGLVGFGFPVGANEDLSFRLVRSFPLEAIAGTAMYPFTLGQSGEVSAQFSEKLGRDRLQVTASMELYNSGTFTDPQTYALVQEQEAYLGDRLEVRPFLGWMLSPGVAMETGLDWKHVFANDYSFVLPLYQGGGNLLGVQQSITFQVDPSTFWNVAGMYQYVYNDKAAKDASFQLTDVSYNRVSIGTNVGWKW